MNENYHLSRKKYIEPIDDQEVKEQQIVSHDIHQQNSWNACRKRKDFSNESNQEDDTALLAAALQIDEFELDTSMYNMEKYSCPETSDTFCNSEREGGQTPDFPNFSPIIVKKGSSPTPLEFEEADDYLNCKSSYQDISVNEDQPLASQQLQGAEIYHHYDTFLKNTQFRPLFVADYDPERKTREGLHSELASFRGPTGLHNLYKRPKLDIVQQELNTAKTQLGTSIKDASYPQTFLGADYYDRSNKRETSRNVVKGFDDKKKHQEYLPATLNFPYKDFIAKNKQQGQLKLWQDEEEQSRLEKHFNPIWQVEFFSKFYSSQFTYTPDHDEDKEQATILKTDNLFLSKEPCAQNEDNPSISHSKSDTDHHQDDELSVSNHNQQPIFENMKNSIINYGSSPKKEVQDHPDCGSARSFDSPPAILVRKTSFSSLLQEAALNLCSAMDKTDETRDAIYCFEKNMNINRDYFLKKDMHQEVNFNLQRM